MHWNSTWWHAGGMWLFWLAVFVIVGVAIFFAIRSMKKSEPRRESPKEALERKFARGEIDREEFDRAKKDLRQF